MTLSDPLPAGLGNDVSWQIDTTTGNASAFTITGAKGSQVLSLNPSGVGLAAGASLSVHVTATTYLDNVGSGCGATGTLTNVATVTAANESPTYQNAHATATITIVSASVTISGTKFTDATGNGFTADDAGQSGVTIDLYRESNRSSGLQTGCGGDTLVASTTTASNGAYSFTGLAAGTYYVQEVVPAGYVQTGGGPNGTAGNTYYTISAQQGQVYGGNNFDDFKQGACLSYLSNIYYVINGTTKVTDLRGNTHQGDQVQVFFTVANVPGAQATVTLVSYTAPDSYFNANDASQQVIFDLASGTFGPGTYSLTVQNPNCNYQIDCVCGPAIDHLGPAGSNIFYSAQNRLISADNEGSNPYFSNPASLTGSVFVDANENGIFQPTETGLAGVAVTLKATTSIGTITLTRDTAADGSYSFKGLPAGTYTLTETEPSGYLTTANMVGTVGGTTDGTLATPTTDTMTKIVLAGGNSGVNYNFGELPCVAYGDFATIGFWHNCNGQALIKSLNGGSSSTALAQWLATSFPNLYGPTAGVYSMVNSNGTYFTNAQVAASYNNNFYSTYSGATTNAQVLAAALGSYATSTNLAGGTYAKSYSFNVSAGGTGSDGVTLGCDAAAFGNNASLTVLQMLQSVNSQAVKGVLYANSSQKSSLTSQANDAFSTKVNSAGDIAMLVLGDQTSASSVSTLTSGNVRLTTLFVYVDDSQGNVTSDEESRIEDGIAALNADLGSLGVDLVEVPAELATTADITVSVADSTDIGGASNGVLGLTEMGGIVTIVSGWNWYAGADPTQIGADQYDFQTVVTHELGHAVGLGHSADPTSVMYAYLSAGEVRHDLSAGDIADITALEEAATSTAPEPLMASPAGLHRENGLPNTPASAAAAADVALGQGAASSISVDVFTAAPGGDLASTPLIAAVASHGTLSQGDASAPALEVFRAAGGSLANAAAIAPAAFDLAMGQSTSGRRLRTSAQRPAAPSRPTRRQSRLWLAIWRLRGPPNGRPPRTCPQRLPAASWPAGRPSPPRLPTISSAVWAKPCRATPFPVCSRWLLQRLSACQVAKTTCLRRRVQEETARIALAARRGSGRRSEILGRRRLISPVPGAARPWRTGRRRQRRRSGRDSRSCR